MKKYICTLLALLILLSTCTTTMSSCSKECEHQGEWIVATDVTCTTAGLDLMECRLCGYQQTKTVPAKGHSWLEATCTTAKICSTCNLQEGEALGHSYTSETTKESQCTIDGIETHTCSLCNHTYETIINKKGHTNVLQDSGEDICSVCNAKSFSTYSTLALTALYQRLKAPKTATINYIYAGNYTWEQKKCVVVIISCTAQVTAGGLNEEEFVILFDLKDKKMTFNLQEEMQDKADYYDRLADQSSGYAALNYLDRCTEYLEKVEKILYLRRDKAKKLKIQDISEINDIAKIASGAFN